MEDELYYLREGFDASKDTISKLTKHINEHTFNQVPIPSGTKKARVVELFQEHVYSRRETILSGIVDVKPSGDNIEDSKTRSRGGRTAKPRSAGSALGAVQLEPPSPARPRTRSRSPLRQQPQSLSAASSPRKRRSRAEALKEAIEEHPELGEEIKAKKTSSPAKTKAKATKSIDPTAELLLSQGEAQGFVKSEELTKSPRKPRARKSEAKSEAKAEPKSKNKSKAKTESKIEETSFTSDNVFQSPKSTDFKRKRKADPEDASLERPARRRDVAPHKHRLSETPQIPQNAQAVFSDAPDLHAPANLTQEPFNISYGEANDDEDAFVDNVLQMPDANELTDAITSTPSHNAGSSWLPSFNQVQQKVSSAVEAVELVADRAEKFAKDIDGIDADVTRQSTIDPENPAEDISTDKEDEAEAPAKNPWYKLDAKLPNVPAVPWKSIAKNTLKYFTILFGSIVTLSVIFAGSYLLYWVRDQKTVLGFCESRYQAPVVYPGFLEADLEGYHSYIKAAQAEALSVFEALAPQCTPCPENAKCTRFTAQCKETYVQQWPLLSYLGAPLPPYCVKDPVKLYKLHELKKRAVAILNQKRADFECNNAESADVDEDTLKAQLREKKLQGVSDDLFEELYEKIRADFIQEDVDYPEISFSRQVHQITTDSEDTLTTTTDSEPQPQETLYFKSSSLAYLSFSCHIKRTVKNWTREHQTQLRQIFAIAVAVALMFGIIAFNVKRHYRLQRVYQTWMEMLQQAHEEAENDPTGQEHGWLAEHILLHQLKSNQNDRLALQKRVENNPNVRIRDVEQAGEIIRTWEWIA